MFIPIRTDNKHLSPSPMVISLIILNTLVFLIYAFIPNQHEMSQFVYKYGLIPNQLTSISHTIGIWNLAFWKPIFTHLFCHGSILHFVGNMWMLWIFGRPVEKVLGSAGFALFYILGGIAASAFYVVFNSNFGGVIYGASGAVSAVLAMYYFLFPLSRVLGLFIVFLMEIRAIWYVAFWAIAQLLGLLSPSSSVPILGLIGGALFGFALYFSLKDRFHQQRRKVFYV